ncbi:MAG TPA: ABC transporter substrate-binding protein [Longimicrobiales bacterium]|nr:ABC transporter substrate-binding protein [Longimicrobiales bacterium]
MNRIERRTFLRRLGAVGIWLPPALIAAGRASGRTASGTLVRVRLGAVWPAGDPDLDGIRLGADEAGHAARLFGTAFVLHQAEGDGTRAGEAAERLIRDHDVLGIVGGATAVAADAIAAAAAAHDAVFLNVGTPREQLMQACSPGTFHINASEAMRRHALGTVRDSPAGAYATGWHPSLERFGAGQVNDRFRRAFGRDLSENGWYGWIAVKLLFDAAQRAGTESASELAEYLVSGRALFDGHKGLQLSFHPDTRQLRQPLYIVAGDRVIAQVPEASALGDMTHAELLDSVAGGKEATCAG